MASFVEVNVGGSLESRKKEFERMVSALNKELAAQPAYATWVKFQIGNFALDTSDPEQQFFTSLNYTKNGSGQANSFTLMIAYEPKLGDMSGSAYDPNLIDKQLTIYKGDQKDKLKCWLQYGYGHGPDRLISPLLEGMVLDYDSELRDGLLFYTITGYSGIVETKEFKINVDEMKMYRPTEAVKEVFEQYLGPDSPSKLGYVVEYGPDTEETDKVFEAGIPAMSDVTIFQYANQVLAMAVPEGLDPETPEGSRPFYTYDICETKDKKVITIQKIDPKSASESMKTSIVFNWMDKRNSLVRTWQYSFKGAILLAQNFQDENGTGRWGIDDAGNPIETDLRAPAVAMNKTPGGESNLEKEESSVDEVQEKHEWSKAVNYSYKAEMGLIGIPCDIPIGLYIEVVPLIYGKPHHTAGNYMVTKSTDQIDSGGFVTTLELIKVDLSTESE